uniref:Hydroxysteroid 11-beta dehydrogenase 1 like n=1 Tax=Crocodylus porosus TaxID=8502 RepID=A0A7M4EYD1_CROPO
MSARWKALWAAGIATGLLAFFWRDTFNPGSAHMLLTGASAGIGEQMAYHYSRFGTEIVLTARREAVLQKKCLQLGTKKVFYIPADMSCPAEPERVMQFAVQKIGGLDYLVLNHIGGTPFQMWDGDVQHTRWLLQVGFLRVGALWGWRRGAGRLGPCWDQSKGSVVVVSSVSGKIATPFTTSCSATRLALDGFFSFLRHELATQKKDVSITLCVLGLIDTETALEKMRPGLCCLPGPAACVCKGLARPHTEQTCNCRKCTWSSSRGAPSMHRPAGMWLGTWFLLEGQALVMLSHAPLSPRHGDELPGVWKEELCAGGERKPL